MSEQAIRVRNLVKLFSRRGHPTVRAIDDLTFDVRRGAIFGLLGPNGAGKTTLLRILSTLARPTTGTATVLGHDVVAAPLDVRRLISVVIQESAAELFLSVRDNLGTFARFHGLDHAEIQKRTKSVLEDFGLAPEAHRKVQDLSGGFRRRVQVAKVFMVNTPVVFLDEFSTGMDPILKRSIMEKLRREAAAGRTIVLTTQILGEAEELCDDILILNRGRQAARGDLHTLKLLSQGVYDVTVTLIDCRRGSRRAGGSDAGTLIDYSEHRRGDVERGRPRHPGGRQRSGGARTSAASRDRRREPGGHLRRADAGRFADAGRDRKPFVDADIAETECEMGL